MYINRAEDNTNIHFDIQNDGRMSKLEIGKAFNPVSFHSARRRYNPHLNNSTRSKVDCLRFSSYYQFPILLCCWFILLSIKKKIFTFIADCLKIHPHR